MGGGTGREESNDSLTSVRCQVGGWGEETVGGWGEETVGGWGEETVGGWGEETVGGWGEETVICMAELGFFCKMQNDLQMFEIYDKDFY